MHAAPKTHSVGEVLVLLKTSLVRAFPSLCVVGEVVDPFLSRNGHLYLRLQDPRGELRVVMWRREAQRLRSLPQPGDRVVVLGSLTVFESRGELQFQALALAKEGLGDKLAGLSQLRDALQAEGLFDRPKRPVPLLPGRLGVVTSLGSAVLHDIFLTVRRRSPSTPVYLSPAPVSGAEAPAALGRALDLLRDRVDLVIIARGGGSFEELVPFSDEALVRKVAGFPVPVISAIGHGSDSTLLDLVADATAPTPTAAAELATPVRDDLLAAHALLRRAALTAVLRDLRSRKGELSHLTRLCRQASPAAGLERARVRLDDLKERQLRWVERRLDLDRDRLGQLQRRSAAIPWKARLQAERSELKQLRLRLENAYRSELSSRRKEVRALSEACRQLGPMEILRRGFALVLKDGALLTSIEGRRPGEELELLLADGRLRVTVNSVAPLLAEETP